MDPPQAHHHPPTPQPTSLPLPTLSIPLPPSQPYPLHPGASTAPLPSYHPSPTPLQPPRPRLKRSHPTTSSDRSSSSSSSDDRLQALVASPPAPSLAQVASANALHARARSSSSSLDPIKEWPSAEASPYSGLGMDLGAPNPRRGSADDEAGQGGGADRPRAVKRMRLAPDHDALARLSLSSPAVGMGGTNGQLPTPPLWTNSAQAGAYPSAVPSFPQQVAPQPPSSPLPLSHQSALLPSAFPPPRGSSLEPPSSPSSSSFFPPVPAAPPTSPVNATARGLFPSSSLPGGGAGGAASGVPTSQHLPERPLFPSAFFSPDLPSSSSPAVSSSALFGAPEQEVQAEAEEVDMRPPAAQWDIDPHRVYVASLDDDEDEAPNSEKEGAVVNPLALHSASSSSALPPAVLSSLRASSSNPSGASNPQAGSLILYRPPPAFPGALGSSASPSTLPSEPEGARERVRRERKEREWEEYRRRAEREERGHDEAAQGEEGEGEGEGMDLDG
ncbi:hypothetical protein JCM8097_001519 [Rhodosporidiobolus ruineniae]